MPEPNFDAFYDDLVMGGVAPRHASRASAELKQHYLDLRAELRSAGFDREEAASAAAEQLGSLDTIGRLIASDPGAPPLGLSLPDAWPPRAADCLCGRVTGSTAGRHCRLCQPDCAVELYCLAERGYHRRDVSRHPDVDFARLTGRGPDREFRGYCIALMVRSPGIPGS